MKPILNITAKEVEKRQGDPSFHLLDVRSSEEFRQGHIPGSVLLPEYEIPARCEKLLPRKGEAVAVYCQTGARAAAAAALLSDLGYQQVFYLGSILEWPHGLEK